MAPVKKTLQQYKVLRERLTASLNELREKEARLKPRQSVALSEETVSIGDGGQSGLVTDILVEIIQLKLGFLNETITALQSLVKENSRQPTPFELQVSRFEDWVDTNQQLYELNARLYDTQKNMLDIRRTQAVCHVNSHDHEQSISAQYSLSVGHLLQTFKSASTGVMSNYVSERLHPKNNRMTFEATKIEEYIQECTQYNGGTLGDPQLDSQGYIRGAHPKSYHSFVEVLCHYITERHRSSQGQELKTAEVYTAIEHHLIPRIKPHVMSYIVEQEKDDLLSAKCQKFESVTLSQIRVPPEYHTKELIPFANAIAYLKGSIFSESPTDKMYSIVKAAKSLHDMLSEIGNSGIDGDTFLDLWIYVTIKANMKDMATNVKFMTEYGNPQLSIGEAGYYLTTITAAMNYIEDLTADKLGVQMENNSRFIVCENERVRTLCNIPGSGFEIVEENIELSGYRVAVVHKWALDTSRLFHTVLLPTNDDNDKVLTTIFKLSNTCGSPESVQYFYDKLTEPHIPWIVCANIMNCVAKVAAPNHAIKEQLIMLPPGPTEESIATLIYIMTLIRISSETVHVKHEDSFNIYHYSKRSSHSYKLDKSQSIEDVFGFDMQSRSRFSLPVKRFKNSITKKSNRSSIMQTERLLGRNIDRNLDHPTTPPPSDGTPPKGIVIMAEIHGNASSTSLATNTVDSIERDDLGHREQSLSPVESPDIGLPDYFSREYMNTLERNFVSNHFNGNESSDLRGRVMETVQQCQLILQRLNYLSMIHKLDGIYDNIVMDAVQLYQITCNEKRAISSVILPLDGILNVPTYQRMRQEYAIRFNDMIRACKDLSIPIVNDTDADLSVFPLSTKHEDIVKFAELVTLFQQTAGITQLCRSGVLCNETVSSVHKLLQRRNTFS